MNVNAPAVTPDTSSNVSKISNGDLERILRATPEPNYLKQLLEQYESLSTKTSPTLCIRKFAVKSLGKK